MNSTANKCFLYPPAQSARYSTNQPSKSHLFTQGQSVSKPITSKSNIKELVRNSYSNLSKSHRVINQARKLSNSNLSIKPSIQEPYIHPLDHQSKCHPTSKLGIYPLAIHLSIKEPSTHPTTTHLPSHPTVNQPSRHAINQIPPTIYSNNEDAASHRVATPKIS